MVRPSLIGALAAVLLCVGVGSEGASAHADLTGSTPADGAAVLTGPDEIVFVFSEPIVVEQSSVQVTDSAGAQRDNGDFHHHGDATNPGITVPPGLPDGPYTVTWDVASATDGHRTSGTFVFAVGNSPVLTGAPSPQVPIELPAGDEGSDDTMLLLMIAGTALAIVLIGGGAVIFVRRRG